MNIVGKQHRKVVRASYSNRPYLRGLVNNLRMLGSLYLETTPTYGKEFPVEIYIILNYGNAFGADHSPSSTTEVKNE
jgi:hypothetical protein